MNNWDSWNFNKGKWIKKFAQGSWAGGNSDFEYHERFLGELEIDVNVYKEWSSNGKWSGNSVSYTVYLPLGFGIRPEYLQIHHGCIIGAIKKTNQIGLYQIELSKQSRGFQHIIETDIYFDGEKTGKKPWVVEKPNLNILDYTRENILSFLFSKKDNWVSALNKIYDKSSLIEALIKNPKTIKQLKTNPKTWPYVFQKCQNIFELTNKLIENNAIQCFQEPDSTLFSSLTQNFTDFTILKTNRLQDLSLFVFGYKNLCEYVEPCLKKHSIDFWKSNKNYFQNNHYDFISFIKSEIWIKLRLPLQNDLKPAYDFLKKLSKDNFKKYINSDFNDVLIAIHTIIGSYRLINNLKKRFEKGFNENKEAQELHNYLINVLKKEELQSNTIDLTLPTPKKYPEKINQKKIFIPNKASDLKRIGNAQNHCVGTRRMGYIDKIISHKSFIFTIYTKNLSDGVCVEYDRNKSTIIHAQGKHNRPIEENEKIIVEKLIKTIIW